jgi:hypothetical protein
LSFQEGSKEETITLHMRKNAGIVLELVAGLLLALCPEDARAHESEREWQYAPPQGSESSYALRY